MRGTASTLSSRGKSPRPPAFVDGKDELDNYLLRFERLPQSTSGRRLNEQRLLARY